MKKRQKAKTNTEGVKEDFGLNVASKCSERPSEFQYLYIMFYDLHNADNCNSRTNRSIFNEHMRG